MTDEGRRPMATSADPPRGSGPAWGGPALGPARSGGDAVRIEGVVKKHGPTTVLHGIDLTLRTGERLAIVGPSGSGKSTLGRLLSGINGPRTGSVRVGGVELTALPLESLRTEVALVTQEHHVFVGSVRDNILLAREGPLPPRRCLHGTLMNTSASNLP